MSKENINLPKTAFSMKANLPAKEPGMIEYWDKINLYQKLRESSKNKENLSCTTVHLTQMEISIWVLL